MCGSHNFKCIVRGMQSLSFIPGRAFLSSNSPAVPWTVVFEDEGVAGYFYACDRSQTVHEHTILDAMLIYNVAGYKPKSFSDLVDATVAYPAGTGLDSQLVHTDVHSHRLGRPQQVIADADGHLDAGQANQFVENGPHGSTGAAGDVVGLAAAAALH